MGMAAASQWIFNFVVAKCTPIMFATLGTNGFGTYFLYGSFCFAMVIYAFFLVPETKAESSRSVVSSPLTMLILLVGLSLEMMDEVSSHKDVRVRFEPSQTLAERRQETFVHKNSVEVEHVERQ